MNHDVEYLDPILLMLQQPLAYGHSTASGVNIEEVVRVFPALLPNAMLKYGVYGRIVYSGIFEKWFTRTVMVNEPGVVLGVPIRVAIIICVPFAGGTYRRTVVVLRGVLSLSPPVRGSPYERELGSTAVVRNNSVHSCACFAVDVFGNI